MTEENRYVLSIVNFIKSADKLADALQDRITYEEDKDEKAESFELKIKFRESIHDAISHALEELYGITHKNNEADVSVTEGTWDIYEKLYDLICSAKEEDIGKLVLEAEHILQNDQYMGKEQSKCS